MVKRLILIIFFVLIPSIALSAGPFYVDCSAGSSGDGSYGSPWNTTGDVNDHSFSTSEDVYFKVGTTCNDARLVIDWAGTSEDRVIIGAYESEGDFTLEGGETLPIIDGNGTLAGDSSGLVHVGNDINYVTIQDLRVYNSNGEGIMFDEADEGVVQRVEVELTEYRGIYFYACINPTLKYSDITDTNHYGNGAGVLMRSSTGSTIQYSQVHQIGELGSSGGECVNLYLSTNSTVEYNSIWDCISTGIYFDHTSGSIARYNLIYFTGDEDYLYKGSNGILFNDESYLGNPQHAENGQIYGNIIAGAKDCFDLSSGSGNGNDPGLKNVVIYANTCVKPRDRCFELDASSNTTGTLIKNNSCWGDSSDDMGYVENVSGLTFDYNAWSHDPTDADLEGANDPAYGQPYLLKTTGWDSLTGGSVDGTEFSIVSPNSPLIDGGVVISSYNDRISSSNYVISGNSGEAKTSSITVSTTTDGTNPDIGAWYYNSGETDAPTPNPATLASSTPSTGQIAFELTEALDVSTPISYYFLEDPDSDSCATECSSDYGTGGSDSGEQSGDNTFTDDGLQTNKCYCGEGYYEDALDNAGSHSTRWAVYTLAEVPDVTLGNQGAATFDITGITANGNPEANPTTTYACKIVSASPADPTWQDQYIDTSDGSNSATAVWDSKANWDGGITLAGLNDNTYYGVGCYAKNGDGVITNISTIAYVSTGIPPDSGIFNIKLENIKLENF